MTIEPKNGKVTINGISCYDLRGTWRTTGRRLAKINTLQSKNGVTYWIGTVKYKDSKRRIKKSNESWSLAGEPYTENPNMLQLQLAKGSTKNIELPTEAKPAKKKASPYDTTSYYTFTIPDSNSVPEEINILAARLRQQQEELDAIRAAELEEARNHARRVAELEARNRFRREDRG